MSKKILLVYDDYAEMIRLQTDLMKVGFDVVGIVNEALLSDQVLSFHPDVVIAAGKGGKVSALHVAQKLKENTRYQGSVILLLPPNQRPNPQDLTRIRMDVVLELPLQFGKLLQNLSRILSLDASQLIDKYMKARVSEGASADEIQLLKSLAFDRNARFEKALKGLEIDKSTSTFQKSDIKKRQEIMKKDWDFKQLAKIDELKQKFAQALFKKSK